MAKKTLRKLTILAAVIVCLSAIIFLVLWESGSIQGYLERRAVKLYLEKIEPILPFKVERIQLAKFKWGELLAGNVGTLSLQLREGPLRMYLEGPLEVKTEVGTSRLAVFYRPKTVLETVGLVRSSKSTSIQSQFWLKLQSDLSGLSEVGVFAEAQAFSWSGFHVDSKEFSAALTWSENRARGVIQAQELKYEKSDEEIVSIVDPYLGVDLPLTIEPLKPGPEFRLDLQAKSGEVLLGETYLDLPLSLLPTVVTGELALDSDPPIGKVGIQTGKASFADVLIDLNLRNPAFSLNLKSQNVENLIRRIFQMIGEDYFEDPEILRGRVTVSLKGVPNIEKAWFKSIEGRIRVRDAAFLSRSAKAIVNGIEIDLPFSSLADRKGSLFAKEIRFQKMKARFKKTPLFISKMKFPSEMGGEVVIPFQSPKRLGLELEGARLDTTALKGEARMDLQAGDPSVDLEVSLSFPYQSVKGLARWFCVKDASVPPAEVTFDYQPLRLNGDSISTKGNFQGRLFGGTLNLNGVSVRDFTSNVPEIRFDADWSGVKLDQFGTWSGFGRMEGTLEGKWERVIFQSWLPTRYVFFTEAKPFPGEDQVVFDPGAMKNFVELLTGDDLNMPGIAEWFAFGWPSRLFGGYDVYYVGISILSEGGSIEVRTLDAENAPSACKQGKNHYILCGPRFKIPIQSSRYPVILDATRMTNLFWHVAGRLNQIKSEAEDEENKSKESKDDESKKPCEPDHPLYPKS